LVLSVLFSAFFLVSISLSAVTYSKVTLAQQKMTLEDPLRTATLLGNGTLVVGLTILVNNPGDYLVHVATISWYTQIDNVSGSPPVIPLGSSSATQGLGLTIPAKDVRAFTFQVYVSGQKLSELKGYVNYKNSQGGDVNITTLQYKHSFEIRGWFDDFNHEYLREDYLNQLVEFDLRYVFPEAVA